MQSSPEQSSPEQEGWEVLSWNRKVQKIVHQKKPPPPQPSVEAPVRKIILQMHTPVRTRQCWSLETPACTPSVQLDAPGQRHGRQPVSGTADPLSSPTGKVIPGLR